MEFKQRLPLAGGILSAILLVGIVGWASWYFFLQGPPDPKLLLTKAWQNTIKAESYSFSSSTEMVVDGKKRVLSKLEGQIQKDGFRVKGEMLSTPVELYQIGKIIYLKDVFGGNNWKVFENSVLERQPLVTAEINPIGYLQFKDTFEANIIGEEKFNDRKVYRVEVQPDVDNQFLAMLYTNFRATFLIGKRDHLIWKAVLTGVSKQKAEDKITIDITIKDYKPVKLVPPVKKLPEPPIPQKQ
ncbi:MAG: hypothetical protein WA118_13000 [Carboxydocellales bacterium]